MSQYSDSEDSSLAAPSNQRSTEVPKFVDTLAPPSDVPQPRLQWELHTSYFDRCLFLLPHQYSSADTNRMTFGFFSLSGLDLLGKLNEMVPQEARQGYIDWIYAQQIHPDPSIQGPDRYKYCGFRGSPCSGGTFDPTEATQTNIPYDRANLAMTYTALCSLLLLRDDFSRLNRDAILGALSHLQQKDGSFVPVHGSTESDLRFTFCGFATAYILDGWSAFNVDLSVEYILSSQTYEFALSQGPNLESHGGPTYCGIAALTLAGRLEGALRDPAATLRWCLKRQGSGFHGRLNKPDDTCYSFWIGAAIEMLGGRKFINPLTNRIFLYSAQTKVGGFSKYPGGFPDALHSYMGLAALALMDTEEAQPPQSSQSMDTETPHFKLKSLFSPLNISCETHDYWQSHILTKYAQD